jgi:hypothetical protein
MIDAAMGGVLVDPVHNLHYVEGTYFWDGVLPMALVGIARAFVRRFHAVSQALRREGLRRDADRVDRRRP